MPRMHQARKRQQKTLASQRIEHLTRLAEHQALHGDLQLAQTYLQHARNIATRVVVPLPARIKRQVCKNCGTYLLPGVTSRTRIHSGRIIHCCLHCGALSRHPLHHKTTKPRASLIDDQ